MSFRTRGTTLVELLIALTLVAIFSTVLLQAMSGGTLVIERARQRAAALSLARDAVEGQRVVARSGSLATETVNTVAARDNSVGPFAVQRVNSTITTGGITGLYRINVQVTWTNYEGSGEKVELELWIGDYEE